MPDTGQTRALRALSFLLPLFAATPLLVTACAAPTHYAGIDLRPGSGIAAEVQALAEQARAGSKQAQLDLGIRYEEGNGLPHDVKRARRLYRMAAATTGGTIYVYQPPVRKGGRGGVVPVNLGPVVRGLDAARVRITSLLRKPSSRITTSPANSPTRDTTRGCYGANSE